MLLIKYPEMKYSFNCIIGYISCVIINNVTFAEYLETVIKFDNFRFDSDIVKSFPADDISDCSLRCTVRAECLSIQHHKFTGQCRLFKSVFLTTTGAIYEKGWRYFQKTGGKCPTHFTYSGVDGLCFHDGGELTRPAGVDYCGQMGAGLIPVVSERIELFLENILEKQNHSYSGAASAYIQGSWNSTHWVDDEGHELSYTKWKPNENVTLSGSKNYNIKLKRYGSGYFWVTAGSGRFIRNVFCGVIIH